MTTPAFPASEPTITVEPSPYATRVEAPATDPFSAALASSAGFETRTTPEEQEGAVPPGGEGAPPPETGVEQAPTREQLEAVQRELAEIKAWREQEQAKLQEAEQARQQQAVDQQAEALSQQYFQEFQDAGMDTAKAQSYASALVLAQRIMSPVFMQQVQKNWNDLRTRAEQAEQKAHAYDLIFGTGIADPAQHFPPNTTLASLRKHLAEITKWPDKERREWAAAELRRLQYQSNLKAVQDSGAERIEDGGGTPGLGMSATNRYKDALKSGKPLPSAAEIDRMTAAYLR